MEIVDVSISTLDKLSTKVTPSDLMMNYLSFEKDDDSNGHIDFITEASVRWGHQLFVYCCLFCRTYEPSCTALILLIG